LVLGVAVSLLARNAQPQDLTPYLPPPCVAGQEMFQDVPASNPFCRWVEQVARDSITGGCAAGLYCPSAPLTRAQMAVFLETAMRGTATWDVNADLLDGMDSGEFILGITTGTGVQGGAPGGNVTLSLLPSFQLPQSCTGGQYAQWNGAAWACGTPTGGGTVTQVNTGAGLTGGPITTSGTLSVAPGGITSTMVADGNVAAVDIDATQVQRRVASCPAGQTIQTVNQDGTVGCLAGGTGTVTSVGTGTGLTGGPITTTGTISVVFGGTGSSGLAAHSNHNHFNHSWIGDSAGAGPGLTVENVQGEGIRGRNTHTTGGIGVSGQATGEFGMGVSGHGLGNAGVGVEGLGNGSGASFGVRGLALNSNGSGAGVYGARLGWGVGGRGSGGNRAGVLGETTTASGYGVWGRGISGNGSGVRGDSFMAGGVGVRGENTTSSGTGVYGAHQGSGYAINGVNFGSGYAGYFEGRVHVTGTLTKGGGSFRIDHPLDPENKYLYHSFVESPDMKNIYDGVVTTDERGHAVVQLPEWFEALNRDFRYQLTIIDDADGEDFVSAKVTRRVANNSFTIRTSAPGVEVSWQVTGIRKDAWAEANRIPVEELKPPGERAEPGMPD
jgi:hypothetical protein